MTTPQASTFRDEDTSLSPVAHGSSDAQLLSHQAATGQVTIAATAKLTPEPAHLITSDTASHLTAASAKGAKGVHESKPVLVDSEEEEEEEEDILRSSVDGDEVGKLLRTTVSELETALQV